MDVRLALKKLQPLHPKRVAQWKRTLALADRGTCELLERHIIAVAMRELGDVDARLLLPPPSRHLARGELNLGTVIYEKDKWPVGLSRNELLQHLAIFGRSGAGKTNAAFHILHQLVERKIPFLFLDWKRTARHLIPYLRAKLRVYTPGRSLAPFPFNPFIPPPGLEARVYIHHVVDVMGDAFTLGDGSKSLLHKALAATYAQGNHAPTVQNVLSVLSAMPSKERASGWKISATRALESLAFAGLSSGRVASQEQLVATLLEQNTVIELDALSQSGKKFLMPLLCLWLYYVRLAAANREEVSLVVFIEEAHHVLYRGDSRSKESLMNMLLRQCRELGIAMVVIDQHPHLISSAALGNTYTSICMNLKDPADITRAAGLCQLDDRDKKHLSLLPTGSGIVKLQDRWRHPLLVRIPHVAVPKGKVTDDLLAAYSSGSMTLSALRQAVGATETFLPRSPGADNHPGTDAFALLVDVLKHPDDGVDHRYQRLSWSTRKGQQLKEQLLGAGLLEEARIKKGRTHRTFLRITRRARESLNLEATPRNSHHESLEHEYWKKFYAQLFRERGYQVQVEAPRRIGAMDVLATKGPERIAVEIETGKSDVVHNVRQNLLTRAGRVIVVATNPTALDVIEHKLAAARLLIQRRVEVVYRDNPCFEYRDQPTKPYRGFGGSRRGGRQHPLSSPVKKE